jgi:choline dehydrogenase-like flavoprotein
MTRRQPDAVVIGSGATGGWAAKELTEAGLEVTLLDAGPELDPVRDRYAPRSEPVDPALRERQPIQSRYGGFQPHNHHLFVDDVALPYATAADKPFDWIRSRQVGGRTLLWGGVALRMSDHELRAAARDGYGDPWPIFYRDLEHYYDVVESFIGVSGSREGLAQLPDGSFLAAEPMTEGEKRFKSAVEARWPERRVINGRGILDTRRLGASAWPALTSNGTTLEAAKRTGRLTLRPNAIVREIGTDPDTGRARHVAWVDRLTREEKETEARVFVLAASSIESARILLGSTSPRHPNGLSNSSGLVGRYLMDHTVVRVLGHVRGLTVPHGDPSFDGPRSIHVPRFRNLDRSEATYLRGFGCFGAIQRAGIPFIEEQPDAAPFICVANGEMLPQLENRVVIDRSRTDAWSCPIARIECAHSDNDAAMLKDAIACIEEMVKEAGMEIALEYAAPQNPGYMNHEVGTARMGDDPKRSVLNPFCQSWDVSNLFVMDGSCFVSCGWQNPTLTMMALAVRSSEHLVHQLKRMEL